MREAASEARVEGNETLDFRTVVPVLQRIDAHAIPFNPAGKHIHNWAAGTVIRRRPSSEVILFTLCF